MICSCGMEICKRFLNDHLKNSRHGKELQKRQTLLEEKNLELLKDEPICCHLQGMTDLLEEAKAAKEQGIKFAEKVPSPTIMLK